MAARHTLVLLVGAAVAAAAAAATAPQIITLDGSAQSYPYDGFGGLSAGASSRLLYDYPEPQRSDILDLLFKPSHGMQLHTLKVEIGGDTDSTDGTEMSHMHTADDLSCDRGYEIWLVGEAVKRNPSIRTFALSWGVPAWLLSYGGFFSDANHDYQVKFAECVRNKTGVVLDFIGIWNERPWGSVDYVVGLRQALDRAGFASTRIVIPDGAGYDTTIISDSLQNSSFLDAWDVMGLHYPCPNPASPYSRPNPHDLGKKFWASEDWWEQPDWNGAASWGRLLSRHFVIANMTSAIAWSPIWSVYPTDVFQQAGLMLADSPWSGNYDVSPPIWTSAVWGQLTSPGWVFLSTTSGSSGMLPGNGSYVTLVDPAAPSANFTLILETFTSGSRCNYGTPVAPLQTLTFQLINGLPGPGARLAVWLVNETDLFVRQADVVVAADSTFSVSIAADSMVAVTTVMTAQKGQPANPIPPPAPFPFPYSDDFSASVYPYDGIAKFFSDQFGAWAARNGSLTQVAVGNPGSDAWITDADPTTILGDPWNDTVVGAVGRLERVPPAGQGRRGDGPRRASRRLRDGQAAVLTACDATSRWQVWRWNVTGAGYLSNDPNAGRGGISVGGAKKRRRMRKAAAAAGGIGAEEEEGSSAATCPHLGVPGGSPSLPLPLADAPVQCLNIYGCQTDVVYWSCVTTGGTCCGGSCYQNLQWTLTQAGGLVTHLDSAGCVTAPATGDGAIVMAPCGSPLPATQTWSYDSATGLVKHAASGLCLVQPAPPPPRAYLQVCARLGRYGDGSVGDSPNGYCLVVGDAEDGSETPSWALTAGTARDGSAVVLANGTLPSPFDPTEWHALNLTVTGSGAQTTLVALVDGAAVTPAGGVVDAAGTYASGLAVLGSGYHPAYFDSFYVGPPPQ